MENDSSLALLRPAGLYGAGEERQHRVSNRGRPRTSCVEEKVMEFLGLPADTTFPTRLANRKEVGKVFAAHDFGNSEWTKGVRTVRADDSDAVLTVA
jgi:hypothetical protein